MLIEAELSLFVLLSMLILINISFKLFHQVMDCSVYSLKACLCNVISEVELCLVFRWK